MINTESINKTNQSDLVIKNKRPKYGGRKAMPIELKPKPRRINDNEYQLIQVLRDKHLLDQCLAFALSIEYAE